LLARRHRSLSGEVGHAVNTGVDLDVVWARIGSELTYEQKQG
jgi:hypothetical protein